MLERAVSQKLAHEKPSEDEWIKTLKNRICKLEIENAQIRQEIHYKTGELQNCQQIFTFLVDKFQTMSHEITSLRKNQEEFFKLKDRVSSIETICENAKFSRLASRINAKSNASNSPEDSQLNGLEDYSLNPFQNKTNSTPSQNLVFNSESGGKLRKRYYSVDETSSILEDDEHDVLMRPTTELDIPSVQSFEREGPRKLSVPPTGIDMNKEIHCKKSPDRSLSLQNTQSSFFEGEKFKPKRLFENFMLISSTKEDVKKWSTNPANKSEMNKTFEPAVLFDYAETAHLKGRVQIEKIETFVFPSQIEAKKLKQNEKISSTVNKVIIKVNRKYANKFIAPLCPHSIEAMNTEWNSYINATNIINRLYIIGITRKDFYVISDKKRIKENFVEVRTGYCFLTYYPYPQLFYGLLGAIFSLIKKQRKNLYLQDKSKFDPKKADFSAACEVLNYEVKYFLDKLLSAATPKPGDCLVYEYHDERLINPMNVSYQYPETKKAWLELGTYRVHKIFNYLGLDNLVWLLSALVLEKQMVLFSENIFKLTYTINTLTSLLCPIKYPFSVVGMLPEETFYLMQSPLSVLLGCNKSEDCFIESEFYKAENTTFVFLDSGIIFTQVSNIDIPIMGPLKRELYEEFQEIESETCQKFVFIDTIEKYKIHRRKAELNQGKFTRMLSRQETFVQGNNSKLGSKDKLLEVSSKNENIFEITKNWITKNLVECMKLFEGIQLKKENKEDYIRMINQFTNDNELKAFLLEFKNTMIFGNYPATVCHEYLDFDLKNPPEIKLKLSSKTEV